MNETTKPKLDFNFFDKLAATEAPKTMQIKPKSYNASHRKKVQIKKCSKIFNSIWDNKKITELFIEKQKDLFIHGQASIDEKALRFQEPDERG